MAKLTDEDIVTVNGIPLPLRKTRKHVVYTTLGFCGAVIAAVTYAGDPANTLHVSAQSWAFGTSIAIIMGYVFGAVADNYNLYKNVDVLSKLQK